MSFSASPYALHVTQPLVEETPSPLPTALNRLVALNTLALALLSTLNQRQILELLATHLNAHLGIDALVVMKYQSHMHTLTHMIERGFQAPRGQGFFRSLSETDLASRVLHERQLVRVADLPTTPTTLWPGEGFGIYYGLPLGQYGLIELFQREGATPLTPDDLDFAQSSALQAGLALEQVAHLETAQLAHLELSLAQEDILQGWARSLDLRSKETEGHTWRVTDLTLRLARAMGLNDADLARLRQGALLHDIGKAGLPESLLLKTGFFSDEEWQLMCMHPVIAYELLYPIPALRASVDIPYCHHERWDGTGYPRKLKGEEIPLAARIFAVADVWDALQSDRPYRPGQVEKQVRNYIRSNGGKHFDPAVVEVFLKVSTVE